MLFECMGSCVLSPAHESEMRGYLVLCADYKILIPPIFFLIQLQYIRLDGFIVEFWRDFIKHF